MAEERQGRERTGGREAPGREPREEGERLSGPWWYPERRAISEEQRREVLSQLFFEGPDRRPFLSRFSALLVMSVLIAAFGLAQDSAPVVIGAMLVSPLTTPLLGLATSLVLGQPRRQLESVAILLAASVGGAAVAAGVMLLLPEAQNLTISSEQLLARTEPGLLDLAVAIVAGGAGAFVLVRREAVSALPGVAIAVALVPPLTTVGMTLEAGRSDLADGALLLYATNLAGIILASGVVMLLMGVEPRLQEGRLPHRARVGLATALLAAIAVAVPLGEHTRREVNDSRNLQDAQSLADAWARGWNGTAGEVSLEESGEVRVPVSGPRRPRRPAELAEQLARELDEQVEVIVEWTPRQTFRSSSDPG